MIPAALRRVLERTVRLVDDLTSPQPPVHAEWMPFKEALKDGFTFVERRHARAEDGNAAIPTGLAKIDNTLGGWPRGCVSLITGAQPNLNATLLRQSLFHAIYDRELFCAYVSLDELPARSLAKVLCCAARVSYDTILIGNQDEDEWADLILAVGKLADAKCQFVAPTSLDVDQLAAKLEELAAHKPLDAVFVDSLDGLRPFDSARETSTSRAALRRLSEVADTIDAAIVVTGSRPDSAPVDVTCALSSSDSARSIRLSLTHGFGPRCDFPLRFDKSHTRLVAD